jgi:hypothetical protein
MPAEECRAAPIDLRLQLSWQLQMQRSKQLGCSCPQG